MTDREEVIKQLKKLKSFHNGSYGEAINFAIESLKVDMAYDFEFEKVESKACEKNLRWIPVSEELPKEWKFISNGGYVGPSDYVLVLGEHGMYGISRYWGNRKSKTENPDSFKDWIDLDWVEEKPIAWMPLPEPYKESEVEDE